ITIDPILFGAGDSNPWRYVGNIPVLFNDPTGLAENPLWQEFVIGLEYSNGKIVGSTKTALQARILVSRRFLKVHQVELKMLFASACFCVARALDLVQNSWEDIKSNYQVGINMSVLLKNRDFYIKAMKKIVDACKSADTLITVHCVEEQSGK